MFLMLISLMAKQLPYSIDVSTQLKFPLNKLIVSSEYQK